LFGATVRVVTRNGLDWTDRLPAVAREIGKLGVDTALLDGELVALDTNGASSFPALQAALSAGKDATLHEWTSFGARVGESGSFPTTAGGPSVGTTSAERDGRAPRMSPARPTSETATAVA